MKLIFATQNPGKLKEFKQLLIGLPIDVVSAKEAGVTDNVVEDQETFAGNALKKAEFVAKKTGEMAVADDSGVMIEALGGQPGVMTARWAGERASADELIAHTLKEMKDVPEGKRQATFHSAVVLAAPDSGYWTFEGEVRGRIATKEQGKRRAKLPYDTIFIPEGGDRSFGDMTDEEKNALSHRGRAFQQLKEFLVSIVGSDTAETAS